MVEDCIKSEGRSVCMERRTPGGHLVENSSARKEVSTPVQLVAAGLFGRHVGDGAKRGSGSGKRFVGFWRTHCPGSAYSQLCKPKIHYLDLPAGRDEDVV